MESSSQIPYASTQGHPLYPSSEDNEKKIRLEFQKKSLLLIGVPEVVLSISLPVLQLVMLAARGSAYDMLGGFELMMKIYYTRGFWLWISPFISGILGILTKNRTATGFFKRSLFFSILSTIKIAVLVALDIVLCLGYFPCFIDGVTMIIFILLPFNIMHIILTASLLRSSREYECPTTFNNVLLGQMPLVTSQGQE